MLIFSQAVHLVNGSHEKWLSTDEGIPQYGVLSPLLFTVYANNLPDVLLHSFSVMHTDDTAIYTHSCPDDLPESLKS